MLVIENISKAFGEKTVLNKVSFSLEKGEILGISGKSGVGKSTLGKILVGLEELDEGEVVYNDKVIINRTTSSYKNKKEAKLLRRDIQFIFQNPYTALDNKVKVGKILTETLKSHFRLSEKELEERITKLLTKCRLDKKVLNKYPDELSGGQRQRIIIMRAILLEPKIIICDEITASLDVAVQNEILNLLLELKKDFGLSYIFITHNPKILEKFCDRVLEIGKE